MDIKTRRQLMRLAADAELATARRDAAIREALTAGASLREVAVETGLSHGGVAKIRDRKPDR